MEAFLPAENYTSSSSEEEDLKEERGEEAGFSRRKSGVNVVVVDPAPNVNVANLALTKDARKSSSGIDDFEAAAKRGGKALSSSASRSVVKVVPKSAVAQNANEEEFLQPNAQVLTTNLTYEQMSAKVKVRSIQT